MGEFRTLTLESDSVARVAHLRLNRPAQRNALSKQFFSEFPAALAALDSNRDVNVIVLSGVGDHFCAGIDLSALASVTEEGSGDQGRRNEHLRRDILYLQDAITAIESCRKPVIVAIHGCCIGGGVDLITACDLRYCSSDAFFSVKEVDLGITADLGTLQRLPGIVGYGRSVELALTGRRFSSQEAKEMGLISSVFATKKELDEEVRLIAAGLAAKSPLAITGTKLVLLKGRDVSISQALDYVATWNSAMLLSDDLKEAISATMQKRKPVFAKL